MATRVELEEAWQSCAEVFFCSLLFGFGLVFFFLFCWFVRICLFFSHQLAKINGVLGLKQKKTAVKQDSAKSCDCHFFSYGTVVHLGLCLLLPTDQYTDQSLGHSESRKKNVSWQLESYPALRKNEAASQPPPKKHLNSRLLLSKSGGPARFFFCKTVGRTISFFLERRRFRLQLCR